MYLKLALWFSPCLCPWGAGITGVSHTLTLSSLEHLGGSVTEHLRELDSCLPSSDPLSPVSSRIPAAPGDLVVACFLLPTDQRIHLFLKCCFVLGVQRSLLDLPGGLTLIEAELAELGQKFVSLTHHNQQVFAPYYTEILKTLISPAQTLTTKGGSL